MVTTASVPFQRHRLTVHDFHRMGEIGIFHEDERVELIEGEVVDMLPIGSPHAGTVKYLAHVCSLMLGERAIVSNQDPVYLGLHSEPQPDLAVLQPRADFYRTSHPKASEVLLVIEVADASLRYDLDVKVPLYARHGIPEVWVVDIVARCVHRFSKPGESDYTEREMLQPQCLAPLAFPDCSVDFAEIL